MQHEAVSRIAMKGTNVHGVDLPRACCRGDVELVEDYVIVDRSCLKQTYSYLGDDGTPFSHACSAGRLPVVEAILEQPLWQIVDNRLTAQSYNIFSV